MNYYDQLGKYEPDVLPSLLDDELPILCTACFDIIDEPDQSSWWLGTRQNYGPFCTHTCAAEIQWEAYVNDDEDSLERTGPYHVSEYDPATGNCLAPWRFDVLEEREEDAPIPNDSVFLCANCEKGTVYNPGTVCDACHREGVYHCMGCETGLCGEGDVYCDKCKKEI